MKNNQFNKNLLICGDNLKALNDLKKQDIEVDLIYLDPPFFSNRQYEVVWGDEAEIRSFEDRWEGGINVYIDWMRRRIVKMYDVLKDTGSFYLHCDWHASHYLKIMLDEVFGHRNFRNEIIWHYRRWTGAANYFLRMHDVILFFTKTNEYDFNPLYTDYTKKSLKRKQHHHTRIKGDDVYITSIDKKGVKENDVWIIPVINPAAKERLGYPTQKPETLLERIIKASSKEDNLILDPFCGCGTTMAVAQKLKRKWIGVDISPTAISLVEKRLEKLGAIKGKDFDSIGMPTTITELKKLEPFEFQNWVINEMQAKQSRKLTDDKGIDGYVEKSLYFESAGIQVKQSPKVGRNVVFNFETALRIRKFKKGYIVAFSFTKGAHEEASRAKDDGLNIRLIEVKDLLKGKTGLLK